MEPHYAADIAICSLGTLKGAVAHRRRMAEYQVGIRQIPSYFKNGQRVDAREEPIMQWLEVADCTGAPAHCASWGWAKSNGSVLCDVCWADKTMIEEPPADTSVVHRFVAQAVAAVEAEQANSPAASVAPIMSEPPDDAYEGIDDRDTFDDFDHAPSYPFDDHEWTPSGRRDVEMGPELP